MSLIPDKLFVNLYPKSIGPCVGSAFETLEDANRCANSHRITCVELGARIATSVVLTDKLFAEIVAEAVRRDTRPINIIEHSFLVDRAIHSEVRGLLYRYAAEQRINFATAVAEACRAFTTEATR